MVVVVGGGDRGGLLSKPCAEPHRKGAEMCWRPPPLSSTKRVLQHRGEAKQDSTEQGHSMGVHVGTHSHHSAPLLSAHTLQPKPSLPPPPEVPLLSPALFPCHFSPVLSASAGGLRALRWILTGHAPLPPSLQDVRMELMAAGGDAALQLSETRSKSLPPHCTTHSWTGFVCEAAWDYSSTPSLCSCPSLGASTFPRHLNGGRCSELHPRPHDGRRRRSAPHHGVHGGYGV